MRTSGYVLQHVGGCLRALLQSRGSLPRWEVVSISVADDLENME